MSDPTFRVMAEVNALLSGLSPADKVAVLESVRAQIHEIHPNKVMPVNYVRWVPIEKVRPNDYNPNSVAKVEMGLLYTSIDKDGYTQPIVTVWNPTDGFFDIVDGFHRYFTAKSNPALLAKMHGYVPIVVINKPINERMASTVRHNRARGKHSVGGMSSMVFAMLSNGWADEKICNELGMQPEELLRLKHTTGFSKLFANEQYGKAWVTERQTRIKAEYLKSQQEGVNSDSGSV